MKTRWGVAFGLLVAGCLAVVLGIELVVLLVGGLGGSSVSLPGMKKIALLTVDGVIFDTSRQIEFVNEQREDDAVKALVLRIDSPGGGAAASQELFRELMKFRETGRPVIASVGALGASGGYYLAAAADTIYVAECSQVGSIGVIMDFYNISEVLRKIGLAPRTFTAGTMKDVPSATRDMSDTERQYVQGILDDVHDQFISDICRGRDMERVVLEPLADGRVYTGRQALAFGLVDAYGTLDDAKAAAAAAAGISGEPRYTEYKPPEQKGLLQLLTTFGERLHALLPPPQVNGGLRFQYAP